MNVAIILHEYFMSMTINLHESCICMPCAAACRPCAATGRLQRYACPVQRYADPVHPYAVQPYGIAVQPSMLHMCRPCAAICRPCADICKPCARPVCRVQAMCICRPHAAIYDAAKYNENRYKSQQTRKYKNVLYFHFFSRHRPFGASPIRRNIVHSAPNIAHSAATSPIRLQHRPFGWNLAAE